MTKVYIPNDNSPFPGRTANLEELNQQLKDCEEHFEYCLDKYGDADEDTIQAEQDVYALQDLIDNSTVVETA
jgi:hypothetical protein